MWDGDKIGDSLNERWQAAFSNSPDIEVVRGFEDIKHRAGDIIWKDLAVLQEIDLEQFERAGIEELVIGERWKVTYTYLGYPIEITFAHGCIFDDKWLTEPEIHNKILVALWCGQVELPMKWNAWIHIPADIALGLWLERKGHVLRGEFFNSDNASETWKLLTLENHLLLAEPRKIKSILDWELEPQVNHILVPNIYVRLYSLLKDRAWNK